MTLAKLRFLPLRQGKTLYLHKILQQNLLRDKSVLKLANHCFIRHELTYKYSRSNATFPQK